MSTNRVAFEAFVENLRDEGVVTSRQEPVVQAGRTLASLCDDDATNKDARLWVQYRAVLSDLAGPATEGAQTVDEAIERLFSDG